MSFEEEEETDNRGKVPSHPPISGADKHDLYY